MVHEIIIHGQLSNSRILVGEKVANLKQYLPQKEVFVITDKNLLRHYKDLLTDFKVICIEPGDSSKSFTIVEEIIGQLLAHGADRSSFILGFGGGVVCDLSGFVASIFMRGVSFGFVSTSLLSIVDASVGGKNGINFNKFKNLIGLIRQPEFVLCDNSLLHTLEPRELSSGFAEVIKYAAIDNSSFFSYLEQNSALALALDDEVMLHIVKESISIKLKYVESDELETGLRRILNFGHTLGHAIEGNTSMLHGESVAIGMLFAARISQDLGLISSMDVARLKKVIEAYNLPVSINHDKDELFSFLLKDKKKQMDSIHYVLLEEIGAATTKLLPVDQIKAFIYDLY